MFYNTFHLARNVYKSILNCSRVMLPSWGRSWEWVWLTTDLGLWLGPLVPSYGDHWATGARTMQFTKPPAPNLSHMKNTLQTKKKRHHLESYNIQIRARDKTQQSQCSSHFITTHSGFDMALNELHLCNYRRREPWGIWQWGLFERSSLIGCWQCEVFASHSESSDY